MASEAAGEQHTLEELQDKSGDSLNHSSLSLPDSKKENLWEHEDSAKINNEDSVPLLDLNGIKAEECCVPSTMDLKNDEVKDEISRSVILGPCTCSEGEVLVETPSRVQDPLPDANSNSDYTGENLNTHVTNRNDEGNVDEGNDNNQVETYEEVIAMASDEATRTHAAIHSTDELHTGETREAISKLSEESNGTSKYEGKDIRNNDDPTCQQLEDEIGIEEQKTENVEETSGLLVQNNNNCNEEITDRRPHMVVADVAEVSSVQQRYEENEFFSRKDDKILAQPSEFQDKEVIEGRSSSEDNMNDASEFLMTENLQEEGRKEDSLLNAVSHIKPEQDNLNDGIARHDTEKEVTGIEVIGDTTELQDESTLKDKLLIDTKEIIECDINYTKAEEIAELMPEDKNTISRDMNEEMENVVPNNEKKKDVCIVDLTVLQKIGSEDSLLTVGNIGDFVPESNSHIKRELRSDNDGTPPDVSTEDIGDTENNDNPNDTFNENEEDYKDSMRHTLLEIHTNKPIYEEDDDADVTGINMKISQDMEDSPEEVDKTDNLDQAERNIDDHTIVIGDKELCQTEETVISNKGQKEKGEIYEAKELTETYEESADTQDSPVKDISENVNDRDTCKQKLEIDDVHENVIVTEECTPDEDDAIKGTHHEDEIKAELLAEIAARMRNGEANSESAYEDEKVSRSASEEEALKLMVKDDMGKNERDELVLPIVHETVGKGSGNDTVEEEKLAVYEENAELGNNMLDISYGDDKPQVVPTDTETDINTIPVMVDDKYVEENVVDSIDIVGAKHKSPSINEEELVDVDSNYNTESNVHKDKDNKVAVETRPTNDGYHINQDEEISKSGYEEEEASRLLVDKDELIVPQALETISQESKNDSVLEGLMLEENDELSNNIVDSSHNSDELQIGQTNSEACEIISPKAVDNINTKEKLGDSTDADGENNDVPKVTEELMDQNVMDNKESPLRKIEDQKVEVEITPTGDGDDENLDYSTDTVGEKNEALSIIEEELKDQNTNDNTASDVQKNEDHDVKIESTCDGDHTNPDKEISKSGYEEDEASRLLVDKNELILPKSLETTSQESAYDSVLEEKRLVLEEKNDEVDNNIVDSSHSSDNPQIGQTDTETHEIKSPKAVDNRNTKENLGDSTDAVGENNGAPKITEELMDQNIKDNKESAVHKNEEHKVEVEITPTGNGDKANLDYSTDTVGKNNDTLSIIEELKGQNTKDNTESDVQKNEDHKVEVEIESTDRDHTNADKEISMSDIDEKKASKLMVEDEMEKNEKDLFLLSIAKKTIVIESADDSDLIEEKEPVDEEKNGELGTKTVDMSYGHDNNEVRSTDNEISDTTPENMMNGKCIKKSYDDSIDVVGETHETPNIDVEEGISQDAQDNIETDVYKNEDHKVEVEKAPTTDEDHINDNEEIPRSDIDEGTSQLMIESDIKNENEIITKESADDSVLFENEQQPVSIEKNDELGNDIVDFSYGDAKTQVLVEDEIITNKYAYDSVVVEAEKQPKCGDKNDADNDIVSFSHGDGRTQVRSTETEICDITYLKMDDKSIKENFDDSADAVDEKHDAHNIDENEQMDTSKFNMESDVHKDEEHDVIVEEAEASQGELINENKELSRSDIDEEKTPKLIVEDGLEKNEKDITMLTKIHEAIAKESEDYSVLTDEERIPACEEKNGKDVDFSYGDDNPQVGSTEAQICDTTSLMMMDDKSSKNFDDSADAVGEKHETHIISEDKHMNQNSKSTEFDVHIHEDHNVAVEVADVSHGDLINEKEISRSDINEENTLKLIVENDLKKNERDPLSLTKIHEISAKESADDSIHADAEEIPACEEKNEKLGNDAVDFSDGDKKPQARPTELEICDITSFKMDDKSVKENFDDSADAADERHDVYINEKEKMEQASKSNMESDVHKDKEHNVAVEVTEASQGDLINENEEISRSHTDEKKTSKLIVKDGTEKNENDIIISADIHEAIAKESEDDSVLADEEQIPACEEKNGKLCNDVVDFSHGDDKLQVGSTEAQIFNTTSFMMINDKNLKENFNDSTDAIGEKHDTHNINEDVHMDQNSKSTEFDEHIHEDHNVPVEVTEITHGDLIHENEVMQIWRSAKGSADDSVHVDEEEIPECEEKNEKLGNDVADYSYGDEKPQIGSIGAEINDTTFAKSLDDKHSIENFDDHGDSVSEQNDVPKISEEEQMDQSCKYNTEYDGDKDNKVTVEVGSTSNEDHINENEEISRSDIKEEALKLTEKHNMEKNEKDELDLSKVEGTADRESVHDSVLVGNNEELGNNMVFSYGDFISQVQRTDIETSDTTFSMQVDDKSINFDDSIEAVGEKQDSLNINEEEEMDQNRSHNTESDVHNNEVKEVEVEIGHSSDGHHINEDEEVGQNDTETHAAIPLKKVDDNNIEEDFNDTTDADTEKNDAPNINEEERTDQKFNDNIEPDMHKDSDHKVEAKEAPTNSGDRISADEEISTSGIDEEETSKVMSKDDLETNKNDAFVFPVVHETTTKEFADEPPYVEEEKQLVYEEQNEDFNLSYSDDKHQVGRSITDSHESISAAIVDDKNIETNLNDSTDAVNEEETMGQNSKNIESEVHKDVDHKVEAEVAPAGSGDNNDGDEKISTRDEEDTSKLMIQDDLEKNEKDALIPEVSEKTTKEDELVHDKEEKQSAYEETKKEFDFPCSDDKYQVRQTDTETHGTISAKTMEHDNIEQNFNDSIDAVDGKNDVSNINEEETSSRNFKDNIESDLHKHEINEIESEVALSGSGDHINECEEISPPEIVEEDASKLMTQDEPEKNQKDDFVVPEISPPEIVEEDASKLMTQDEPEKNQKDDFVVPEVNQSISNEFTDDPVHSEEEKQSVYQEKNEEFDFSYGDDKLQVGQTDTDIHDTISAKTVDENNNEEKFYYSTDASINEEERMGQNSKENIKSDVHKNEDDKVEADAAPASIGDHINADEEMSMTGSDEEDVSTLLTQNDLQMIENDTCVIPEAYETSTKEFADGSVHFEEERRSVYEEKVEEFDSLYCDDKQVVHTDAETHDTISTKNFDDNNIEENFNYSTDAVSEKSDDLNINEEEMIDQNSKDIIQLDEHKDEDHKAEAEVVPATSGVHADEEMQISRFDIDEEEASKLLGDDLQKNENDTLLFPKAQGMIAKEFSDDLSLVKQEQEPVDDEDMSILATQNDPEKIENDTFGIPEVHETSTKESANGSIHFEEEKKSVYEEKIEEFDSLYCDDKLQVGHTDAETHDTISAKNVDDKNIEESFIYSIDTVSEKSDVLNINVEEMVDQNSKDIIQLDEHKDDDHKVEAEVASATSGVHADKEVEEKNCSSHRSSEIAESEHVEETIPYQIPLTLKEDALFTDEDYPRNDMQEDATVTLPEEHIQVTVDIQHTETNVSDNKNKEDKESEDILQRKVVKHQQEEGLNDMISHVELPPEVLHKEDNGSGDVEGHSASSFYNEKLETVDITEPSYTGDKNHEQDTGGLQTNTGEEQEEDNRVNLEMKVESTNSTEEEQVDPIELACDKQEQEGSETMQATIEHSLQTNRDYHSTVDDLDPVNYNNEQTQGSDVLENIFKQEKNLQIVDSNEANEETGEEETVDLLDNSRSVENDTEASTQHTGNLESNKLQQTANSSEWQEEDASGIVASDAIKIEQLSEVPHKPENIEQGNNIEPIETNTIMDETPNDTIGGHDHVSSGENFTITGLAEGIGITSAMDKDEKKNLDDSSTRMQPDAQVKHNEISQFTFGECPRKDIKIDTENIETYAINMMPEDGKSVDNTKETEDLPQEVMSSQFAADSSITTEWIISHLPSELNKDVQVKVIAEHPNMVSSKQITKEEEYFSTDKAVKEDMSISATEEQKKDTSEGASPADLNLEINQQPNLDDLPVSRFLMEKIMREEDAKVEMSHTMECEERVQEDHIGEQQYDNCNTKQDSKITDDDGTKDTGISEGKSNNIDQKSRILVYEEITEKKTENAIATDGQTPENSTGNSSPESEVSGGSDIKPSCLQSEMSTQATSNDHMELTSEEQSDQPSKTNDKNSNELDYVQEEKMPAVILERMTESNIQEDIKSMDMDFNALPVINEDKHAASLLKEGRRSFEEDETTRAAPNTVLGEQKQISELHVDTTRTDNRGNSLDFLSTQSGDFHDEQILRGTPEIKSRIASEISEKGQMDEEEITEIQRQSRSSNINEESKVSDLYEDQHLGSLEQHTHELIQVDETLLQGTTVNMHEKGTSETEANNKEGIIGSQTQYGNRNINQEFKPPDEIQQFDVKEQCIKEPIQVEEEGDTIFSIHKKAVEDEKEARQEEEKTDDEKDKEEEDEHEQEHEDSTNQPALMVGTRDTDSKPSHKKSHNILSGMGSKVKHSLAKVKKVITGKSSHAKTMSPRQEKPPVNTT